MHFPTPHQWFSASWRIISIIHTWSRSWRNLFLDAQNHGSLPKHPSADGFEALSCKTTSVAQLLVCNFHHLNYSMQWMFIAVHCFSAHYVECGSESDELSSSHGANSFIQYFKFSVNRQRRIGGVATTCRSPKNRWNPHYIWHFVCAQHEHVPTYLKGLNKFVKYKFSGWINSCVQ